ncbi:MAG: hypothetical protein R2734_10390 [Nocardioides sp.]
METERFAATARRLRDVNTCAGRIRAAFDPVLAALPNLGVLAVLAVGVSRVLHGDSAAGDVVSIAYLLTIVSFPIRSIGWLLGSPAQRRGFRACAPCSPPTVRWNGGQWLGPGPGGRRS